MLDPRLNHVVAVARHGSFTAAANAVGVTQSAITKSVADLERQVGFPIFRRTSRGILVTVEGGAFVERASRLLDDTRELLTPRIKPVDRFVGLMRVGVCPASLEWLLADPLSSLLARHPRIRVEVRGESIERMVQEALNGDVDLAIGYEAAFRDRRDLCRIPLTPLRGMAFVRKGHPIMERSKPMLTDLREFPLITPSESEPFSGIIRLIFEGLVVDWREQLHVVDSFTLVKRIVASTDSAGFVSADYAREPRFTSRFATLPLPDDVPLAPLCCVYRAIYDPKPCVRALISLISNDKILGSTSAQSQKAGAVARATPERKFAAGLS